jgi:hypothetical protein
MNPYFKFLSTFRKNLTAEQKKLHPKEIAILAGKAYREQKKEGSYWITYNFYQCQEIQKKEKEIRKA